MLSDPRAGFSTDHDEDSMLSIEEDEEESADEKHDKSFPAAEPNPIEEVKALAKSETRKMTFWKVFVVLSILLTGAAVSASVYFFLDHKQEDDFKNQVSQLAISSVVLK